MWRMLPGRGGALILAVAMAAMFAIPASPAALASSKKKKKERPPKIQETINDLAYVVSNGEMSVAGVGLVTGLENTGGDSPPSSYRKELLDEMSKAGVEHAERLLASPQVSIVIVKMVIPMGVGPKDPIDVQVMVPPGCPTKSLAGGYLISARLFAAVRGGNGETLRDKELAMARGPVMLGTVARPDDPKAGRVLGGGRVKKEYPYHLVIKESREGFLTAKLLETVVNERFHQPGRDGHQKGMAVGKTPRFLVLDVPPIYHENQARYFRVIRSLPMIDGPELRARRTAEWGKELLVPKTAGISAVKLEALGNGSIDVLKQGLKSDDPQVKFFAAEALAYLNETAGVEALGDAAINRPEFRPYALGALAALDQSASHMMLRKLMDQPDILVRYGAFSALRTLDPADGYLGRVGVLDMPKTQEDDEPASDAMSMEIVSPSRRRRPEDPFSLYLVDSDGPPMVHVARTRRSEIVVFGRQQKLLPPIVLDGGEIMVNAGDNDQQVEVSKIVASATGDADVKVKSSLEVAEVIRRAANLGASYPQIVGLLEKASKQRNLSGLLVVDAVPVASSAYLEAIAGFEKPKRDDEVDRASGEGRGRWRRLFGFFNRGHDTNPAPTPSPTATMVPASATAKPAPPSGLPPLPDDLAPAPRRDDAVKQTAGTPAADPAPATTPAPEPATTAPPRRRILDFLRRDED